MTENRFASAIMHAWMQRGWLAYLAWPVAQLFGLLLKLRVLMYRLGWLQQQKLAVPVIVVGNIFVGGTGKTPFTQWLLQQLKDAGYTPGVISRGYGSKNDAPCVVLPDSLASQVGDEPILLAQHSACPVVVGRNRADAGRALLAAFPTVNVIIADDGLQHLALARDIEIMLFDSRGVGNGWLLPAGPLREPITRRRDITVANLNEGEQISATLPSDTVRMQLKGTRARQLLDANQTRDLSSLDGNLNIIAAAGIGNPERFFTMLRQQGVRFSSLPLPDHFSYTPNPFANLTADMILITEKDAVKCRQLKEIANDPRIWVVAVEAQIETSVVVKILQKLI
ncbi:tetraacyldisaccharide 4'-kinase [Solimicrobium silvestre]|uniref:Tetraacyldisaccharide 4'-kinase n=1 Tax=Solimicrobium silvestre TaxID=2099400 RepID=A0A2S9H4L7_9BURK|nr:tetraacyldisaccharide 4'-kinase [Solimicrobium silvestre]PRC94908.1 lpxK: tetraacyldisaccharide 4'-kinase [Solimicrobium silvestre]